MLRYFIECAVSALLQTGNGCLRTSGVTSVVKRAREARMEAGAKRAYPISEPMAAAIGAGLPVGEPGGMVVEVGGGTGDIRSLARAAKWPATLHPSAIL